MNKSIKKNKRYLQYKGDEDIFLNSKDENKYLEKHNIELINLDNNSKIIASTRIISDIKYSYVNFNFPSGAYLEPKNKQGINHVLEHIISNKSGYLSKESEAYFNAHTNSDSINIEMNGISNLNVKKYGLWPVLVSSLDSLKQFPKLTAKELDSEKEVILREMNYHNSDFNTLSYKKYVSQIFSPLNPINYEIIGNQKSLTEISLGDIKNQYHKIIIPSELITTVFSEGDYDTTNAIVKIIKNKLDTIKSNENQPDFVDIALNDLLNPEFKQGNHYKAKTEINSNQFYTYFSWIMDLTPYKISTFANTKIVELINKKFFRFIRENGIGYQADAFQYGLGEKRALGFVINIPKQNNPLENAVEIFKTLKSEIFEKITLKDLEESVEITKRRLDATPITSYSRFNELVYGIKNFNKLIDSDKSINIHKLITIKDLKTALDTYINIKPTISVIGDID